MKKIIVICILLPLVFNSCKKEEDSQITDNSSVVEGCMDILALNYNPLATFEISESCVYETTGVGDLWGLETSDLPNYYFTSDVPQSQINTINENYNIASNAWGNFGPLEYWIIGNDISLADSLDIAYCDKRYEMDPSLGSNYIVNCLNRGYNFVDYVNNGGAGLNTRRNQDDDYSVFVITHGSKFPSPSETDYDVVAMHEYFHVYQQAHVFTKNEQERASKFPSNPWFVEGGATFMSELLYSQQTNVSSNYLAEVMSWKLQNLDIFLASGIRLEDIQYGTESVQYAYELGAWFTAFLIHNFGVETYLVDFHDDLNILSFEQSFVVNFGKSSLEILDEFHDFLNLPVTDQLLILP